MAMRTIYLVLQRNASSQRAHFAIWVPSATESEKGTLVNVAGVPMVGYEPQEIFSIGQVHSDHIADS